MAERPPARPGAAPAKPPAKDKPSAEKREQSGGDLDDRAHAELCRLYEESWHAVLFAKAQQWKTLGSTLIVYLALVFIAKFVASDPGFGRYLVGAIILVCMAAIFVIIIYQFWQHAEMSKLDAIGDRFSADFQDIRGLKSRTESNIHRYILLTFIIVMLAFGATIAYLAVKETMA